MDLFEAIHSPKKLDKKTEKNYCQSKNITVEEIYGKEVINDDIDY